MVCCQSTARDRADMKPGMEQKWDRHGIDMEPISSGYDADADPIGSRYGALLSDEPREFQQ